MVCSKTVPRGRKKQFKDLLGNIGIETGKKLTIDAAAKCLVSVVAYGVQYGPPFLQRMLEAMGVGL